MSSTPQESGSRFRKNVEDALAFAVAVALSVGAILQLGTVGLAVGCLLLSGAASVVVGREESVAADASDRPVATDGGRER
jgi:hypothetical protein